MKTDIIGSRFTGKLTEFKNFRFDINNMIVGQSILSLFSEPYEVTMKDLETTDLSDITTAYRDLNKSLYWNLKGSDSEAIIVELMSELNDISEFNHSFYNTSSLKLVDIDVNYTTLNTIQKFRAFQRNLDELLELLNQYEKVIILKLLPKDKVQADYINGLYKLIEKKVEHKLVLSVDNSDINEKFEMPLEVHHKVNEDLKKFSSDNYYTQLLFEENLINDDLSIYINHVEEREYIYEVYKDGKPYVKSKPTTSRSFSYKLSEPGKYRIRVHVMDDSVNPRFSQTYEFMPEQYQERNLNNINYVEMPSKENMWMLDALLLKNDFLGLIGNAYQFPEGYMNNKVLLLEEIKNEKYLRREELFKYAVQSIAEMNEQEFNVFFENNNEIKKAEPLLYESLIHLQKKQSNL